MSKSVIKYEEPRPTPPCLLRILVVIIVVYVVYFFEVNSYNSKGTCICIRQFYQLSCIWFSIVLSLVSDMTDAIISCSRPCILWDRIKFNYAEWPTNLDVV